MPKSVWTSVILPLPWQPPPHFHLLFICHLQPPQGCSKMSQGKWGNQDIVTPKRYLCDSSNCWNTGLGKSEHVKWIPALTLWGFESVEGEATSFTNKSSIDLKYPQWWENQKEISVCWLVEMEMCYFGIFRSKWPTGNRQRYLTKKVPWKQAGCFYNYYSTHIAATTQKFTCVLTVKALPWTLSIYSRRFDDGVLTCYRIN